MSKGVITETAQKVLEKRYFLKDDEGELIEHEWSELTLRTGSHFGKNVEEVMLFKGVMDALDFLPNSPAMMNAGTSINAFSACYVLPIEDSIDSIFKYYSDAGRISKSGGGVGANFSNIRKRNSLVNSTSGVASGPMSFLGGQDALTEVIKQGGKRRGANMGILMCDHGDIWDFIRAKDVKGALGNFNLSVGITDEFMEDATSEHLGQAGSKVYESRKMWTELIQRAWSSAEPGVLFMDTIEKANLVPHLGRLDATNPCGEQPLLPYESCTLGSLNLSNMVHYESIGHGEGYEEWRVDYDKLRKTTRTGVLFLNRVLDASTMPIPECQEAMEKTRKIGLGIMGLHDMLIQLGLPYDSTKGRQVANEVMRFIQAEADIFSRELGEKEGLYEGFSQSIDCPIRRNVCLLTIAPTGTISMIADCSSGCEPYYAPVTYKTVLDDTTFVMPNKWLPSEMKYELTDGNPWEEVAKRYPKKAKLFKGANEIHWKDHVKMQAVLQKSIDSSISKTVNMPNDATVEDVKGAYELAYKLGCKGITVYRDGSRESQVLNDGRVSVQSGGHEGHDTADGSEVKPGIKADLPDVLSAKRYRVQVEDQGIYILVCEDSSGHPREVFVKYPYHSIDPAWNTVCRQISLSMRYGIPLEEIIKQLEKSVEVINDVASHLSRILKMYLDSKGLLKIECPDCTGEVIFEEGCEHCVECGWSKCA